MNKLIILIIVLVFSCGSLPPDIKHFPEDKPIEEENNERENLV